MYIQPDGIIELFSDVALSPSYEDTLYFATTQAKDDYFTGLGATHRIGRAVPVSYSREQRGYVRVEIPTSVAYGATYMRFKNTSFENKWFYAFVTNVEYINNGTTQINFELDYIMTWMGAFELKQCFIERQHTLHDGIGNNIAEEGLSFGDYVVEASQLYGGKSGNMMIIIVYADPNEEGQGGGYAGGIYSGMKVQPCFSAGEANLVIQDMVDQNLGDNIVGVYMMPRVFMPDGETTNYVDEIGFEKPYSSIDGYVPRNKKLFCYPYKMLEIINPLGATQEFKYEYFNHIPPVTSPTELCNFDMMATIGASGEVTLIPKNYNQTSNHSGNSGTEYCVEGSISITNFPQCAWVTDSYEAYRAQTNAMFPLNMAQSFASGSSSGFIQGANAGSIGGAGSAVGVGIMGAISGGLSNLLGTATNALAVNAVRPVMPTVSKGSQSVSNLAINGLLSFMIRKKCITKNYAKMLDDYFDMFGYAVKEKGVPNMNVRPNWTYVKTIGCVAHGDMPADHAKNIESIFDNGVRFWKSIDNIGNYDLPNAPTA